MSIPIQSMAPEKAAITPSDSSREPEPRCEMCSAIPWEDTFRELGLFQCSRQDCDECYPEGWCSVEGRDSVRFEHYDSFVQLEQSATDGCQLCRLLFMELSYKHPKCKLWTARQVVLALGQAPHWKNWHNRKRLPAMYLTPSSEMISSWQIYYDQDMRVTSQRINLDAPLPSAPEGYSSPMNETIETELEKINKQAIQPWLAICQQHHTRCKSPSQHAFINYPKRLVWVGDTTSDIVKLVETGEQCPPYLILSYCWGKSNDSAKTTEANYIDRTESVQTSKLPKTIRDAIQLTRAMGEKYIWIDAMCIKQTDKGHTGDWTTEASKVGDYYANAKCLILASSATESGQGFLGERVAWRYPQRYSLITHGMTYCKTEKICYFARGPEQGFEQDTVHFQPLTERGWCLQERILCPRRLQWTRNGLFWDCNTVHASETEALSGRFPPDNDNPMTRPSTNTILKAEKEEALGRGWTEIVQKYSRMKLTMESDRLFAIHGIASLLARQHGEAYCAGIFGSYLATGLMWECNAWRKSPKDLSELQDQPLNFPTWSWASAPGPVYWPWLNHGSNDLRCFADLIRFPPYSLSPDFAEMPSRELLIKAPLVRFVLNNQDNSRSSYLKKTEILGADGLWEEPSLGNVKVMKLVVNSHLPIEMKPDSVLLAAILLENSSKITYGIILKKVTMRKNGVYMREGMFMTSIHFSRDPRQCNNLKALENGLFRTELTLV